MRFKSNKAGIKKLNMLIESENYKMAQEVLELSNTLAPVATGALRKSGYIKKDGKGYSVGYSVQYALNTHEKGANKRYLARAFNIVKAKNKLKDSNGGVL